jgi:hypothetical protein
LRHVAALENRVGQRANSDTLHGVEWLRKK